ncbi:MAG TPA: hypothetical protein ENJ61_06855 [Aquifex aeolicus]|uniref:LPS export ABC transporter periplasmic protein LptC n=1 Tax=Aquifex aeolicus TaxID=63363 RepID=A0A7C5L399_AQUAO|nr:hypothetical protein [Aquifex aeolicus]
MRFLLFHLLLLLFSGISLTYIEVLQHRSRIEVQEKSIAKHVRISVFGEGGEEWKVEGRELVSFGRELILLMVELRSVSGYVVRANSITFRRDRNTGVLSGNVEIRGTALFVKTDSAVVDFNRNLLYGKEGVRVWRSTNYIEGRSFRAYLKPLRVIIEGVRTKHEL